MRAAGVPTVVGNTGYDLVSTVSLLPVLLIRGESAAGADTKPLRIGAVLSGGQAPGGHSVRIGK